MVSLDSVEEQLKKLKFNLHGWGSNEAKELANILLADEEIYELVNGMYEGGFALLVATDVRVLLVDKKPFNYLTVEDFRFDMISEIDYSHRLFGAHINLSAGSKNLKFRSYNQPRLRKLISHVQHCIADGKKKQTGHAVDQKQHLEQINQQLQAYLLLQHKQQQQFQNQLMQAQQGGSDSAAQIKAPDPLKPPTPELNDYLFAQSLLAQYKANQTNEQYDVTKKKPVEPIQIESHQVDALPTPEQAVHPESKEHHSQMADLYADGLQEIYGKRAARLEQAQPAQIIAKPTKKKPVQPAVAQAMEDINPLKIAYSKLPMALRNKRFGRPSFHSHSKVEAVQTTQPIAER